MNKLSNIDNKITFRMQGRQAMALSEQTHFSEIHTIISNTIFFGKTMSLYFLPILVFVLSLLIKSDQYSRYLALTRDTQVLHHSTNNPLMVTNQTPLVNNQSYLPLILNGTLTYYVSTSGDDSNPGSFNLPWRTIGKAARMAFPGMLVYIRGGVYNEVVEVRESGTESQPIQFMAYPGETPIIDGNSQLPAYWVGLFSMLGDWIQVSGIETRNSRYDGFGLYGDHDLADNVYAHHNQYCGILIKSNYGTVQNSRIWRNVLINEDGGSSFWSTGISATHDFDDGIADYAIIRNNVVWENWGEGISTHNANGTIIEDNISYDNWSANVYISDATDILVQRNFFYATGAIIGGEQIGIMMGDEGYNPPSANINVINNIVYGANRNFYWWQGVQGGGMNNVLIANNTFINSTGTSGVKIQRGSHQNVRFINNIIQQEGTLPIILVESDPDLHFSYNLWSKTPPAQASGPGDVIGDPFLAETGEPYAPGWFRLRDLSPAIDGALSLTEITVDYFGNIRGAIPDIGAIEYFTTP